MNKKFNFRMEKVLKYRENIEQAAWHKFSGAQNSLKKTQEELTDLQLELKDVFAEQSALSGELIDISSRLHGSFYTAILTERISSTVQTVNERTADVSRERSILEGKVQERKVLSTLKEKQWLTYNQEYEALEQKQNDEFALRDFVRK